MIEKSKLQKERRLKLRICTKYIILLIFGSTNLFSQVLPGGFRDNYEKGVEVESNSKTFVSFGLKSLNLKENWQFETGLRVGINQENGIFYGLTFMTLVSRDYIIDFKDNKYFLKMDYYGLDFGYIKVLTDWLDAGGRISFHYCDANYSLKQYKPNNDLRNDKFLLNELALVSAIKIYHPVWLGLESGWRTAIMLQSREYISNIDLSGFFVEINLKFYVN